MGRGDAAVVIFGSASPGHCGEGGCAGCGTWGILISKSTSCEPGDF